MSVGTAYQGQVEEHKSAPKSGGRPQFKTQDPATGKPGREYEGHTTEEALAMARDAHQGFQEWRWRPFGERARLMKAAAAVLRKRREEFAALMTAEMGKTKTEGLGEIEKCAFNCDFFADHAESFLAPQPVDIGGPKA